LLRVIVPDSHGSYIDTRARDSFLSDLKWLNPREIVMLGDHVDVSGVFSSHPRNYVEELRYSYEDDIAAAAKFLDAIQRNAPSAAIHYMEGNHEQHAERWCARMFTHAKDARAVASGLDPASKLELKRRGIAYYRSDTRYMGIAVPGTIKLGKCLFTHGSCAGKHATSAHLDRFGTNVVHGHTHRAQSVVRRTVHAGEIGAHCPGTLAELQPLYLHTGLSDWSHGYAVQFVERNGTFLHINVPIVKGASMLRPLIDTVGKRRAA
jgi:predicted phosphodiesterase